MNDVKKILFDTSEYYQLSSGTNQPNKIFGRREIQEHLSIISEIEPSAASHAMSKPNLANQVLWVKKGIHCVTTKGSPNKSRSHHTRALRFITPVVSICAPHNAIAHCQRCKIPETRKAELGMPQMQKCNGQVSCTLKVTCELL